MIDHPLMQMPLHKPEDLGKPIPNSMHAVSMCLPTWENIVGYEENIPTTMNEIKLGYPRFLIHPYIHYLIERINPDPSRKALPFANIEPANRLQKYIQTKHSKEKIDVLATHNIYIVIFPVDCCDTAERGWQLFGEGISSRHAKALLDSKTISEDHNNKCHIRKKIADFTLTNYNHVFIFSSGMAAIYAVMRALKDINPEKDFAQFGFPYGDTLKLMEYNNKYETRFYPNGDDQDYKHIEADIKKESFAGIFSEFPSNPLLNCCDLDKLGKISNLHNCPLILDETLGACINTNTHQHVDISIISLTKYFSGQGDVMGGAVLINPNRPFSKILLEKLKNAEKENFCFKEDLVQLQQYSENLTQRMEIINKNTLEIVAFLKDHPAIEKVWYPNLTSKNIYDHYARKEKSYGGVLSFVLEYPEENTIPFYDKLDICKGPNLGTVFSLCCPFVMLAHYNELDWAEEAGVSRWLIRLSVGLEPATEIIARLDKALI